MEKEIMAAIIPVNNRRRRRIIHKSQVDIEAPVDLYIERGSEAMGVKRTKSLVSSTTTTTDKEKTGDSGSLDEAKSGDSDSDDDA
ncbi:hypothetical protein ACHAXM_000909, partial [Skeletonema potamos]